MSIDLNDYYITIECLDNVENHDISKWINESGKPKKINRKLQGISEAGGSFTANNLEVISSDTVDVPFLIKNGDKSTINYGKARFVRFFPSFQKDICTVFQDCKMEIVNDVHKPSVSVNNVNASENNDVVKKKSKKRSHPDVEIEIKEEEQVKDFNESNSEVIRSPKTKKRKIYVQDASNDLSLNNSFENKSNKKRQSNTDASLNDVKQLKEELTVCDNPFDTEVQKKKKKKSKVTFEDDTMPVNIKKEKFATEFSNMPQEAEDLSLSSKFTAELETDVNESNKIKKKKNSKTHDEIDTSEKKKKHSKIQNEIETPEKKKNHSKTTKEIDTLKKEMNSLSNVSMELETSGKKKKHSKTTKEIDTIKMEINSLSNVSVELEAPEKKKKDRKRNSDKQ